MFHLILNAPDGSGRARARGRVACVHFLNAHLGGDHRLNPTSADPLNYNIMRTAVGEPHVHAHIWHDARAGMAKPEVVQEGRRELRDHNPAGEGRGGAGRTSAGARAALVWAFRPLSSPSSCVFQDRTGLFPLPTSTCSLIRPFPLLPLFFWLSPHPGERRGAPLL